MNENRAADLCHHFICFNVLEMNPKIVCVLTNERNVRKER